MKIAIFWGRIKAIWNYLLPLIKSRVGDFLLDTRVRTLAVKAVEAAMHVDLDGDGKHDHAVRELATDLKAVGVEYYRAWLAIAIESAYQSLGH